MKKPKEYTTPTGLEIAVIGMSCRFPGANTIEEYWDNLINGVETLSFFSHQESTGAGIPQSVSDNPHFIRAKGIIDGIEEFDAAFFNYSPREAEIMDPQLRVFHESVWDALEHSGYTPYTYEGKIGLYAGASPNTFWELLVLLTGKGQIMGNFATRHFTNKDHLSMRIAYKLNLTGPAISTYATCATSLLTIDLACRGLLTGHCTMALAGGITISLPQASGHFYQEGMIASPDGHCRSFDARAQGTAAGSGAGVVVLKRLEDAAAEGDSIHAVIKGFASTNDGSRKVGYTAPSSEGQAAAITAALHMSEVPPGTIGYVETHGTATAIGDPIEIQSLTRAFAVDKKQYCRIGSVKTNLGHLDCAAGIAGFIKTVLVLKNKLIPPSLHIETPNPKINFAHTPFKVNPVSTPWEDPSVSLRAGINSFGVGGTNVHIVLEEAPETGSSPGQEWKIIPLSARTLTALDTMTRRLTAHLEKHKNINLDDVAYTLQVGREHRQYRRMAVCSTREETCAVFSRTESRKMQPYYAGRKNRPVIFMFPGLGSQYTEMGRDLYRAEPVFRETVDRGMAVLQKELGYDPRGILYPGESGSGDKVPPPGGMDLHHIEISQALVLLFEYALARLLAERGIEPQFMIGYSLGEYTAGLLAGVFQWEDLLRLLITRGRLLRACPEGVMLSVPVPRTGLEPQLPAGLSIAIDNGPSCVVAGSPGPISILENRMRKQKCICQPLASTRALHSVMMEPIIEAYAAEVRKIPLKEPRIPFISNVTGDWITEAEAVDPMYWAAHLRQTVRFAEGMSKLAKKPGAVFIEVGPGHDLSALAGRYLTSSTSQTAVTLVKNPGQEVSDHYYFLEKSGKLWLYGLPVRWTGSYPGGTRRRIPLPTYPYERQRYWIEGNPFTIGAQLLAKPGAANGETAAPSRGFTPPAIETTYPKPPLVTGSEYVPYSNETEKTLVEIWQNLFGYQPIGIHDDFFELGGDSLKAHMAVQKIQTALHIQVPLPEFFQRPTIARLAEYIMETR